MSGTPEQRSAALEKANRMRAKRKDLKLKLKRGDASLARLLQSAPQEIKGVEIGEILCWQPLVGPARVRRALLRQRISETRRVGELTERQLGKLAKTTEVGLTP